MTKKIIVFYLLLLGIHLSCGEKITDNPRPNQPPSTHLTFYPDEELATTTSRQVLHWWGDDPDGKVVMYLYTWENDAAVPARFDAATTLGAWDTTSAYSDTFSLEFLELDTVYTFRISAVDDEGLVDPTPAVQAFPIANTPPEVEFVVSTDIPETTFTVASFYWKGTDLDGDDTIDRYEYVLDDTSAEWRSIPADTSFLNLKIADELGDRAHVFYLRAVDIAGVPSTIIRMPRKETSLWYVRRPIGHYLIIDDYETYDNNQYIYQKTLDSLGLDYSVWNIKLNRNGDTVYDLMPSSVDMFAETLLLFDRVLWYADSNPHFEEAQIAIPRFLKDAGKKIFFSTQFREFFSEQGDPLEFSPVDSLGKTSIDVLPGIYLEPDANKASFPRLKAASWIPFVKELAPKISAQVLYRLAANPGLYAGQPVMAVANAENSFVFFGIPFHQLNAAQNGKRFLSIILLDEFGAP
ncbi:MAG: hypothetical protein ACOY90_03010 [Candidatus Zhuqueibacterota bacterium]